MDKRRQSRTSIEPEHVQYVGDGDMELADLPEVEETQSPAWSAKKPRKAFASNEGASSLGAASIGSELTRWQRFIRFILAFVLPANNYQKITEDKDRLAVAFPALEAETKNDPDFKGTKYVIDDFVKFFQPYAALTLKPRVLFIPLLTLTHIIIFISYSVELVGRMETVNALSGVPVYSHFIFDSRRRYEVWRFFTYAFLHQGCIHFIFTILVQILLGIPLEMVHRWWRVALLYTLGVLSGSMFHSMVDRHTYLAGASGGVYALIGAHIAVTVMNFKDMTYDWMNPFQKLILIAPVRLASWIVFVIIDTTLAIVTRYKDSATKDEFNVGYSQHFLGLIVGLTLGYAMLRSAKRRFWKDIVFWICAAVYIALMVTTLIVNLVVKDYPLTDWRICCTYMSV